MKTNLKVIIPMLFAVVILSANTFPTQATDWEVPAKYQNMENPQDANAESLKLGKAVYKKHCASCHGKEGLGDGTKAAQLDTPSGDFTTDAFQNQTDGALFYKSKFGRDEMPNYEKKIPYDEDFWHVVNYMRTFE
ncbi:MAG: cytochrome c [Bacteroidia bacterium]|nr:cytochrome c [Bacteroidia bacterium]